MAKPVHIDIYRTRLDDDHVPMRVGVPGGIAGYAFALTVVGQGTIAGSITDATAGEVAFDPAAGSTDLTTLAAGSYAYYVVMTNPTNDERTIAQGQWKVGER